MLLRFCRLLCHRDPAAFCAAVTLPPFVVPRRLSAPFYIYFKSFTSTPPILPIFPLQCPIPSHLECLHLFREAFLNGPTIFPPLQCTPPILPIFPPLQCPVPSHLECLRLFREAFLNGPTIIPPLHCFPCLCLSQENFLLEKARKRPQPRCECYFPALRHIL
jgi:hypothetical protein